MSNQAVITFRAAGKNQNRVAWAKQAGINMAEVMNDLLEKYGDAELKKKADQMRKQMERAKGFEPSTFTLATCAAGLKIIVRAGRMERSAISKVYVSGAVSDSPDHRGNENNPATGPATNWGLRKRLNLAVR